MKNDFGIYASGRSVRSEAVLPDIRRPSLSQPFDPSEDHPLEPWPRSVAGPPLMGFLTTLDESIVAIALQSVKELEGRMGSFESVRPPWGFCPGCEKPEGC
jgi:hypothetical protein